MSGHPRGPEELKATARELGRTLQDMLAMTTKNDPFNVGGPTDERDAEWFSTLWQRFGYVQAHMRRMHYQIVSAELNGPDGEPHDNTEKHSMRLYNAGSKARDLELVDPLAVDDRRNPPPMINCRPHDSPPVPSWEWTPPEDDWSLPTELEDLVTSRWMRRAPFPMGEVTVDGYDWSPGADDPVLCELWIEKTTMDDVLVGLCKELRVNLVRFSGYGSEGQIARLLKRAAEHGKPARIFYVSDFDPAGMHMHTAVARNIEFYLDRLAPGDDIALTRIALTREQVDAYALPRVPIKDQDVRKKNFEDVNGEGAVELDALEALYPGELDRLVRETVEPYRDPGMSGRFWQARAEAKQVARAAFDDATADIRGELDDIREEVDNLADTLGRRLDPVRQEYGERMRPIKEEYERQARPVVEWYQQQREPLEEEARQELRSRFERLDALRSELDETAANLAPDLPERPYGQWTGADDEASWLYRSDRHWLDQLDRYHSEQSRVVKSRTRDCEACGVVFTPPRSDARYCGRTCRERAIRERKKDGGRS